jgi:uncharacterized protein with HEPN domain
MNDNDLELVKTIHNECCDITNFTRGLSFDNFVKNNMNRKACVLSIMLIGESAKKLSPSFKSSYGHIPWFAITGLRNRIAHDYGGIKWQTVWLTITDDIPLLLDFTERLLKSNS